MGGMEYNERDHLKPRGTTSVTPLDRADKVGAVVEVILPAPSGLEQANAYGAEAVKCAEAYFHELGFEEWEMAKGINTADDGQYEFIMAVTIVETRPLSYKSWADLRRTSAAVCRHARNPDGLRYSEWKTSTYIPRDVATRWWRNDPWAVMEWVEDKAWVGSPIVEGAEATFVESTKSGLIRVSRFLLQHALNDEFGKANLPLSNADASAVRFIMKSGNTSTQYGLRHGTMHGHLYTNSARLTEVTVYSYAYRDRPPEHCHGLRVVDTGLGLEFTDLDEFVAHVRQLLSQPSPVPFRGGPPLGYQ